MTSIDMNTLTADQQHVERLRQHGAQVIGPDGNRVELNSFFVGNVINDCIRMNCNAITYDLFLPDIDEPMMIAIWRTGHIDSGSVKSICDCLASH